MLDEREVRSYAIILSLLHKFGFLTPTEGELLKTCPM